MGIADVAAYTGTIAQPAERETITSTLPISVQVSMPTLLNFIYQQARLELLIDYQQPLKPALSSEDKDWVEMILTSAGGYGRYGER